MIKDNLFYINKLKNIVFLGFSKNFEKFAKFNKENNLSSLIITSHDQSKLITKNLDYFIFNKIDKKFKNFLRKKLKIEETLFISISARYIFKKKDIDTFFKNNLINYHNTRLPFDRGAGGLSWRIMNQDRIDNQAFHLVNEKVDEGPIIINLKSLFPPNCNIPKDYQDYSVNKFFDMYSKFIESLKNKKKFKLLNQPDYIGNYFPRLNTKTDALIDWGLNSNEIINFINAFDDPFEGASTYINNKRIKGQVFIKKAQLHGGEFLNHSFKCGIVTRHDNGWIVVAANNGFSLVIEKILNNKGKNIIDKIKVGDRFFTPANKISKSKSIRSKFGSKGLKR